MTKFAKKLKIVMEDKGWTQSHVSRLVNRHRSTVKKWLDGAYKPTCDVVDILEKETNKQITRYDL